MTLRPSKKSSRGPRYLDIAKSLASDIATGTLAAGTQLPTQRALADRLGVSIGTVTRAYAIAERRGLIQGEVGRGTFVRGPQGEALPLGDTGPLAHGAINLAMTWPLDGHS